MKRWKDRAVDSTVPTVTPDIVTIAKDFLLRTSVNIQRLELLLTIPSFRAQSFIPRLNSIEH